MSKPDDTRTTEAPPKILIQHGPTRGDKVPVAERKPIPPEKQRPGTGELTFPEP